jgi:hypothetical protein
VERLRLVGWNPQDLDEHAQRIRVGECRDEVRCTRRTELVDDAMGDVAHERRKVAAQGARRQRRRDEGSVAQVLVAVHADDRAPHHQRDPPLAVGAAGVDLVVLQDGVDVLEARHEVSLGEECLDPLDRFAAAQLGVDGVGVLDRGHRARSHQGFHGLDVSHVASPSSDVRSAVGGPADLRAGAHRLPGPVARS